MDVTLINKIRAATPNEILDFSLLSDVLIEYRSPRDVVTNLLRNEVLIRIKKGIYIFGSAYRKQLVSLEMLSNMIYGPSYVSCEYALSYHGLIPELVSEVTCVTLKRSKIFDTPIRRFSFSHVNAAVFPIGVDWIQQSSGLGFSIASPEKALADMIITRNEDAVDSSTFAKILTEDYRIDTNALQSLNMNKLISISRCYKKKILNVLIDTISEINNAK